MELRLGFLASHGGSNMLAILQAIRDGLLQASSQVVISNNANAKALQTAQVEKIPNYCVNEKIAGTADLVDARIESLLTEHNVNVVVLNGYMKKIGSRTLSTFGGNILNVHPSLLPKYGGQGMYGLRVHEAVIAANERTSGATVHVIEAEYDRGRILGQSLVDVLSDDTGETLAARIQASERILYVEVLQKIEAGLIRL